MKNIRIISSLAIASNLLLSGCASTFFGTVMVISFRDVVLYVFIAFILAILISILGKGEGRKLFWIWFILSLILTPLAGFIYLLIIFSKKSDEAG